MSDIVIFRSAAVTVGGQGVGISLPFSKSNYRQ